MSKIIARDEQIKVLDDIFNSDEAQFIALYGRRRIGKTHLISTYFSNKGLYFDVTGTKDGSMHDQLENFNDTYTRVLYPNVDVKRPTRWRDALNKLTIEFEAIPKNQKIILFFDELPWLATKRSKLLSVIDYFWNTRWKNMPNLIFIVCGSAASWMIDNIVNAKGGLHNRLTHTILLEPFTLKQTEEFLHSREIKLGKKQILDIYMAMGGVAHYLKAIKKGQSAVQAINAICFTKDGLLFNEFPKLYESLFKASQQCIQIVKAIARSREGITRKELLKVLGLKSGALINKRLKELSAAGFIQKYIPYGKKVKSHYYRLIDEYSIFYLRWIKQFSDNPNTLPSSGHWQKVNRSPQYQAWAGYTFEEVCFKHINQIAHALCLDHTIWYAGSWRLQSKKGGAQVDLLFDRDDGVITLCECKYSINQYTIDKSYAKILMNKAEVFGEAFSMNKDIQIVMVTSSGLKKNLWSTELIEADLTLNDLFT